MQYSPPRSRALSSIPISVKKRITPTNCTQLTITKIFSGAFLSTVIFTSAIFANYAAADTRYSRYSEFNQPLFIASLNSENASADELLNGLHGFNLDIAIESDNLSASRFRRLWLEGISINHTPTALERHTGELSRFSRALPKKIFQGDHFVIDYQPDTGTQIRYNNEDLTLFSNSDLGAFLLKGWLGEVPLTSQFRQELMAPATPDAELVTTFTQLQPAPKIDNSDTPAPIPAAEVTVSVTAPAAPSLPTTTQRPSAQTNTNPLKTEAVKTEAIKTGSAKTELAKAEPAPEIPYKVPTAAKIASNPPLPAPVVPHPTTPVLAQQQAKTAPTSQAVGTPVTSQATGNPSEVAFNQPQPEASTSIDNNFDEELLALHQAYYLQLVRELNRFKTIPFQAFQRRWEGTVRLQITIDPSGKVLNTHIIDAAAHDIFNKQALQAVELAAPFSAIPPPLATGEFTFTTQLNYQMAH